MCFRDRAGSNETRTPLFLRFAFIALAWNCLAAAWRFAFVSYHPDFTHGLITGICAGTGLWCVAIALGLARWPRRRGS